MANHKSQFASATHLYSVFFAPRGNTRMFALGRQIAQQYLQPEDQLIGIIGDAGSGKSVLVKGMFPGLELTNDDDGVYVRPLPLLEQSGIFFSPHTYHVDIRFENGFTHMSVLADAISEALQKGKRVIVEHFDLIYPLLGFNANLLIGVGEQILISRPTIFGPEPQEIREKVYESLTYRLMAHTAEDLCELCMPQQDMKRCGHDDVRHGFVITFPAPKPSFDIEQIEKQVGDLIKADLPVTYLDPTHISIDGRTHYCTGPRIHVSRTGQIENFHLLHHFIYDRFNHQYLLVGCVGQNAEKNLQKLDDQQKKQSDLINQASTPSFY